MAKTLLIDADTYVFRAAEAAQYEAQWDNHFWTLHADELEGIAKLNALLTQTVEECGGGELILALSDYSVPQWRKAVMPTYKQHRTGSRKPVIHRALYDYCVANYTTYHRPGLEGDDILGILATSPSIVKGDKVVVSIDKDMRTIPGRHYNPEKKSTFDIAPSEADYNHMLQTLTGDSTDGYPGCPGVGPVKAAKLLSDNQKAWWADVVVAYEKAGLSEEVALQNGRVARILRNTDYDFKNKEVKLWEPAR